MSTTQDLVTPETELQNGGNIQDRDQYERWRTLEGQIGDLVGRLLDVPDWEPHVDPEWGPRGGHFVLRHREERAFHTRGSVLYNRGEKGLELTYETSRGGVGPASERIVATLSPGCAVQSVVEIVPETTDDEPPRQAKTGELSLLIEGLSVLTDRYAPDDVD